MSIPIDGELVTFRDGRWCCTCRLFEDQGKCAHQEKAAALKTLKRAVKDAGSSDAIQ